MRTGRIASKAAATDDRTHRPSDDRKGKHHENFRRYGASRLPEGLEDDRTGRSSDGLGRAGRGRTRRRRLQDLARPRIDAACNRSGGAGRPRAYDRPLGRRPARGTGQGAPGSDDPGRENLSAAWDERAGVLQAGRGRLLAGPPAPGHPRSAPGRRAAGRPDPPPRQRAARDHGPGRHLQPRGRRGRGRGHRPQRQGAGRAGGDGALHQHPPRPDLQPRLQHLWRGPLADRRHRGGVDPRPAGRGRDGPRQALHRL